MKSDVLKPEVIAEMAIKVIITAGAKCLCDKLFSAEIAGLTKAIMEATKK